VTFGVLAATSTSVNNVGPGALGFLVVAGIGVALVFLLRSMNKQFRKITPDPSATPEAPAAPEATAHAEEPITGPS
jgi:hypothetical protein